MRHPRIRRPSARLAGIRRHPLPRFLELLYLQFDHDRILVRSAGLAYTTLLSIVPLTTFLFALFSAFGALEDLKQRLKQFLFSQFLPARQEELVGWFDRLAEDTGRLGFVSTAALVFASILLMQWVELNFNDIWRTQSRRRLVSKVSAYTAVLVLGTLFLGASLTVSARLEALLQGGLLGDRDLLQRIGHWLLPYLLTVIGLMLMYVIVPYAQVRFRSAVVGAVSAGLMWELAKHLFTDLISDSIRYSKLYGSLAVIPIFIVWLYLTWVIVLLGLEITYTHHHFRTLSLELLRPEGRREGRHVLALRLFGVIARRFAGGDKPPTLAQLADACAVRHDAAESIVERLLEAELLRTVAGRGEDGYLPARPLDQIPIRAILAPLFRLGPGDAAVDEPDSLEAEALQLVRRFVDGGERALDDATATALLELPRSPSAAAAGHAEAAPTGSA